MAEGEGSLLHALNKKTEAKPPAPVKAPGLLEVVRKNMEIEERLKLEQPKTPKPIEFNNSPTKRKFPITNHNQGIDTK